MVDPDSSELYLPSPPNRREKYYYFGRRRRWAFAWLLAAASGVMYGYLDVVYRAWLISPLMWLLLTVMVPPVVVNFWLRIGKPRLTLAEHVANVEAYRPSGETVDVFLPSCGEPLQVLDNTFKHVQGMSWIGTKTVYVLDDSARESVRELAAHYGFRYVVRANRGELKKAGNLINAFDLSSGEFIVVLDADFAARGDFCTRHCLTFLIRLSASSRPLNSSTRATCRSPTFSVIPGLSRKSFSGSFSRPGSLQGGDLCRDEPRLPAHRGGGGWRIRAGADRRGCPLGRKTVVGWLRDAVCAALLGQGRRPG